jgi:hypothetical protein
MSLGDLRNGENELQVFHHVKRERERERERVQCDYTCFLNYKRY